MGRFRQAFLVVALALLAHELQDRAAGGRPRPAGAWCGLQTHNTSFTIFSRRVVTPSGVVAAALHVKNGRIRAVSHTASAPEGALDFGDAAISPVRRGSSCEEHSSVCLIAAMRRDWSTSTRT